MKKEDLSAFAASARELFRFPPDRDQLSQWLKLNLGTLLMCVGIYFFKFPNHFITGGVSGISILLNQWIPSLTTATANLILNGVLILVGLLFLGAQFGVKTIYVSLLSSVLTWVLERVLPLSGPLTDQPLLELLFAVGLPAVGSAVLFDAEASSGGTDIIAMLIKKYVHANIGIALLYSDFIIAFLAVFVFDVKTGLYSITGLLIKAVMVDYVMDGLRTYKVFTIVTADPQPICDYILHTLHHSATVSEAIGAFTQEKRSSIMAVVNRSQALQLQKFVRESDPHCFMTVAACSHIVGKGFRGLSE